MLMNLNHKKMQESGFTLLEIIITMVIVAIMATMLFTYSGSKSFTGSVDPIQSVKSANSIHQIMEMITADYQGYPRWKPNTSYATTGTPVTPISRNGYYYKNSGACVSGASDPPWTLPSATSPWLAVVPVLPDKDGTCTWTAVHVNSTIPADRTFIMNLLTLRTNIAGGSAAAYGGKGATVYYKNVTTAPVMQYKIVDNCYITPSNSWDCANGPSDDIPTSYLKVTIQAANGNEKLTSVFTE
jgi:prepilin-type N-terminal cleavage/methylation domain-containing protein